MGRPQDRIASRAPSERDGERLQGHWVLARAGKRVLRPGGRELTERLLRAADPRGRRVVEFAPGLGLTARRVLDDEPASYIGVERDASAARAASAAVGGRGRIETGDAARTGLPGASAELVVGEAMLTMQGERGKRAIIAEARRLLAPGGRYAIHELGLRPDDVADEVKDGIRRELARAIRVNARPLTLAEWRALLESEGFRIEWTATARMALLEPRRLLADEGLGGAARIVVRVLRHRDLRRRILAMRRAFAAHREQLCAVALVAVAVAPDADPAEREQAGARASSGGADADPAEREQAGAQASSGGADATESASP